MFVRDESVEGEVRLKVNGALNSEAAEKFQKELAELAAGNYRTIILDLREVPSINSTSLGKILLLRKALTEEDRTIRINGCSDALYNTFQLINFDRLISIDR